MKRIVLRTVAGALVVIVVTAWELSNRHEMYLDEYYRRFDVNFVNLPSLPETPEDLEELTYSLPELDTTHRELTVPYILSGNDYRTIRYSGDEWKDVSRYGYLTSKYVDMPPDEWYRRWSMYVRGDSSIWPAARSVVFIVKQEDFTERSTSRGRWVRKAPWGQVLSKGPEIVATTSMSYTKILALFYSLDQDRFFARTTVSSSDPDVIAVFQPGDTMGVPRAYVSARINSIVIADGPLPPVVKRETPDGLIRWIISPFRRDNTNSQE